MTKFESLQEDFEKALTRLGEVLKEEKNEIVRDSAIKRFELAFDLAWKTTKAFLEEQHNISCVSPRNCFREAFRIGVIEYDDFWIELTSMRNYTVHAYSEVLAEKIYAGLPHSLEAFQKLNDALKNERTKAL